MCQHALDGTKKSAVSFHMACASIGIVHIMRIVDVSHVCM